MYDSDKQYITQPGWRNRSRSVLFVTAISTITAILYFLPYYTADHGTEVVRGNFIGVALNLIRTGAITPEYIFIAAATALTILLLITAAIRSYISNTISRAALPAFILSFFYTALIFLIGIAVMDFDPTLNPNLNFSIAPAPYFTAILSLVGFFGSMFLLVLQRQNRDDPPYDTPG